MQRCKNETCFDLTISFREIDPDLVKRFLNAAHCGDVSLKIEVLDAGVPVKA